jgi:hypothetical protein
MTDDAAHFLCSGTDRGDECALSDGGHASGPARGAYWAALKGTLREERAAIGSSCIEDVTYIRY